VFLWQEYVSIWYGISGYIVATVLVSLGYDRHWLTDVARCRKELVFVPKPPIGFLSKNAKTTFQKKQKRQL
jgi:hypothetical protein